MASITLDGVTGRKSPAGIRVALVILGIVHTIPVLDQCVIPIQCPVIGVLVFQSPGIEPQIGIVGPKQGADHSTRRTVMVEDLWKIVIFVIADDLAVHHKSFMEYGGI